MKSGRKKIYKREEERKESEITPDFPTTTRTKKRNKRRTAKAAKRKKRRPLNDESCWRMKECREREREYVPSCLEYEEKSARDELNGRLKEKIRWKSIKWGKWK